MPLHYWYFIAVLITYSPKGNAVDVKTKAFHYVSAFKCNTFRGQTPKFLKLEKNQQLYLSACEQVWTEGKEI